MIDKVGARLRLVQSLLHFLVIVEHRETHVVPELGITPLLVRRLLEITECLQVLFVLVQGYAKVVKDFTGSLGVQVANVVMR